MKHVLLFALLLMGTQAAFAQKGFKIAQVQGTRITPVTTQWFNDTMMVKGSGLRALTKPKLLSKGSFSYVQVQIGNGRGESVNAAFEIDRTTGFTSNFRFVCRGSCSSGGSCGFTYDSRGKINGCTCCSLDIERIPSRKLTASDLGL